MAFILAVMSIIPELVLDASQKGTSLLKKSSAKLISQKE